VPLIQGVVSTLSTRFSSEYLHRVLVAQQGNIYVTDKPKLTKITPKGVTTSIPGLKKLSHVVIDSHANLYCTDMGDHGVKKITSDGAISLIAGNDEAGFKEGTSQSASFNEPSGLVMDTKGNLYVADLMNHRVRKITPEGVVSTFAGNGERGLRDGVKDAQFSFPCAAAIDDADNVYIADWGTHRVRKVTVDGVVSTLGGEVKNPYGVVVGCDNSLYVCGGPSEAPVLRRLSPSGEWIVVCGGGEGQKDGVGNEAGFKLLSDVCVSEDGLYAMDYDRVRKVV